MASQDPTRSKYQLLLRCVLILTSVVPPDLPMQMGLAVNMALMALLRASIFCTVKKACADNFDS